VKFKCDSVLRQVTGIAQTISELKHFLPGPLEERASLVGEAITDYDQHWIWKAGGDLSMLKLA
jgi:hypothetical protein